MLKFHLFYQYKKDTAMYSIGGLAPRVVFNLSDVTDSIKVINQDSIVRRIDLNGSGLGDPNSFLPKMPYGLGEFTFYQNYNNGYKFITDTIIIPVDKQEREKQIYVNVKNRSLKYSRKNIGISNVIGLVANNDPILNSDELIELRLKFEATPSDTTITNAYWKVNGKFIKSTVLNLRVDTVTSLSVGLDSISIVNDKTDNYIDLELEKMSIPGAPPQGAYTLITNKLNSGDTTKGRRYYYKFIEKLKLSYNNIYTTMKNNFNPKIILKYQTDSTFLGKPNLRGITTGNFSTNFNNYSLLDLAPNTIKKLKNADYTDSVVTNDCILISKLRTEEKDAITIAIQNRDTSGVIVNIFRKLRVFTPKFADTLKTKIVNGTIDTAFINRIYYKFDDTEISLYMNFNGITSIHNLNFTLLSVGDEDFGKTLLHELLHIYFPFNNQSIYLKWQIIVKLRNKYHYSVGDTFEKNGFCSEGAGHEYFNPENKFVCEQGDAFHY